MSAIPILKRLFCFKKPGAIQLSYLPVLVKDKPLLFVAWELKNAWRIKLSPLGQRFSTVHNAVMLSVPLLPGHITLTMSNYWRKTTIRLPLQFLPLNQAAAAQLIQGFRPLNNTDIHTPKVSEIKSQFVVKHTTIHQQHTTIKAISRFAVDIQPFSVNIPPFNYHK